MELGSSLASQLPQVFVLKHNLHFNTEPCGSWLASDGGIYMRRSIFHARFW